LHGCLIRRGDKNMITKPRLKQPSMISKNENEKGIVLIATIGLIALLVLFGTMGVITTSTEIIISKNHKTSVQARYVAEAGIHRTIGMINSSPGWLEGLDPDPEVNPFSGDNSFGNGTYDVKVYEDDPDPGDIRIITTGDVDGSSSTFEAIVTPDRYGILDYASFDCAGLDLKVSENNVVTGDVYVTGTIDLEESGIQQIIGNVYATGDIVIGGSSSITGNAFANGNIDLESDADPNIDGDATTGTGSVVSDLDKVSGDVYEGVSPDPVADLCSGTDLADITITSEDIQDFRDEAFNNGTYIDGNCEYTTGQNYTGIVHITGDFELTEASTYSDNVIFIVDGNVDISASLTRHPSAPEGSSVIFLVPNYNFKVKGGANVTIDGSVIVGTVYPDGTKTGGDVKVEQEFTNLTVNGNVIAVNGGTDANSGGTFTVNYQSQDDNDLISSDYYAMVQWREIR
jgi:hypothetical protein